MELIRYHLKLLNDWKKIIRKPNSEQKKKKARERKIYCQQLPQVWKIVTEMYMTLLI